jgi:hypothetical protein
MPYTRTGKAIIRRVSLLSGIGVLSPALCASLEVSQVLNFDSEEEIEAVLKERGK